MSTIYKWDHGTAAFNDNGELVMLGNEPYCSTGFRLAQVEEWLTTLEEIIPAVDECHRHSLRGLYFRLDATRSRHQKDHQEVITTAPTADDLTAYLVAYAAATNSAR